MGDVTVAGMEQIPPEDMEDISPGAAKFLLARMRDTCLEKGMRLPFHVALIAVNGSAFIARYAGKFEGEFLAEHIEGGTFGLPAFVMLVDAAGEAATLKINGEPRTLRMLQ